MVELEQEPASTPQVSNPMATLTSLNPVSPSDESRTTRNEEPGESDWLGSGEKIVID